MPLAAVKYNLNLGLNNAKYAGNLDSGQLTLAQGVTYKRGSNEAFFKQGRTAFDSTSLGTVGAGLYYCEFTASGASPRLVARADSSFYHAPLGLTGTFSNVFTATTANDLNSAPTGLWGTFANDRYYFNDGISQPWALQFLDDDYLYRPSGLAPPSDQPQLTIVDATGTLEPIVLRDATTTTGYPPLLNENLISDSSVATYASVSYTSSNTFTVSSTVSVGTFTGTGSGARSDWLLNVTYEAMGAAKIYVYYTTNGGSNYTLYETARSSGGSRTTAPTIPLHTVQIPITGLVNSLNLGVRIDWYLAGYRTSASFRLYDIHVASIGGGTGVVGANPDNVATTGLIYWVTEKIDYLGIESKSGPESAISDAFSGITSIQVSMPTAPQNTNTTHYNVYRDTDGGSFPVGTLAGTVAVGTSYFYDAGPLNQAASGTTYGAFTVAGIQYHRDVVPPIATVMATYQNCVVVAPIDAPNHARYSATGYPESFPLVNDIIMTSDADDRIRALVPLSSQLGVFMAGRGKRVDHLPLPSDPTFSSSPEDFAPDHGIASANGWAYLTPPGGSHTHIAYVARDGIRVTDLYTSSIITSDIDWGATVDVTALASSRLVSSNSNSRLEFYFTPTAAFRTENGWGPGINGCLWVHYQITEGRPVTRTSVQPANVVGAVSAPFQGTDYIYLMSSGVRTSPCVVYVDEVGTTDAMNSVDSSGTIYRRVQTGKVYIDAASGLLRSRLRRLVLDTDGDATPFTATVTGGRDDTGQSWSLAQTFTNTTGGAEPLTYNISGQWHQVLVNADGTGATPSKIGSISWTVEELGELV